MKILTGVLITMLAAGSAKAYNGETDKKNYSVDVQASTVTWKGYKVTGKHHGSVQLKDGSVIMEGGQLMGGEFVMDMTSITVEDLSGDMKNKLEGHLKSDDFFGVATHETATLKINDVKATDGGYLVTADLTIKGITNPIEFNATTKSDSGKVYATADIKIDRSKFNVRYGSNSFFDNLGDKAIYDDFDLIVNLVINEENS